MILNFAIVNALLDKLTTVLPATKFHFDVFPQDKAYPYGVFYLNLNANNTFEGLGYQTGQLRINVWSKLKPVTEISTIVAELIDELNMKNLDLTADGYHYCHMQLTTNDITKDPSTSNWQGSLLFDIIAN